MENLNIKRKTAIVIFSIIALLSVFMFRDNSVDAAGETLGSTADNDVQVSVIGASLKLSLNGGTYTVATDESLYSGGRGVVLRNIYSKDTEGKSVVYSVVIKDIPKNYFASGIGVRGIAVKSGGEQVTVPTEGEENISKSVNGVVSALQTQYPALRITESEGVLYSYDEVLSNTDIDNYNLLIGSDAYLPNADGNVIVNAADALQQSKYASSSGTQDGGTSWQLSGSGMKVTPDTGDSWTETSWKELNGVAPALSYKIKVVEAGEYYLYVNMSNPNNGADSYHIAVDKEYKYTANHADNNDTGDKGMIKPLTWYGENEAISLDAGYHTITIYAREDGLLINQILLTATKYSIDSNHKMLDDSGNVSEGLKDVTDNRQALVSS